MEENLHPSRKSKMDSRFTSHFTSCVVLNLNEPQAIQLDGILLHKQICYQTAGSIAAAEWPSSSKSVGADAKSQPRKSHADGEQQLLGRHGLHDPLFAENPIARGLR